MIDYKTLPTSIETRETIKASALTVQIYSLSKNNSFLVFILIAGKQLISWLNLNAFSQYGC